MTFIKSFFQFYQVTQKKIDYSYLYLRKQKIMKTALFIFLFIFSNVFCFADIAISPAEHNHKEKNSYKESVQHLAPDNNINTELNNSPTIIIKLLKLIWLIIMLLVATILPPLAVLLYFGAHRKFWVCLLLTILGFVPGIIYAWFQIIKGRRARKQGAI